MTPLEQNEENQGQSVAVQALPTEVLPIVGLTELLSVVNNEETKRMLIQQEVERREFVADWKLATAFSNANFFTHGKNGMTAWQAMAKMQIGRAWGMGQAESIRHIYIVNGKPAVENEAVAQKLQAAGWAWMPVFMGEGNACKGCTLWIERNGEPFMRIARDERGVPKKDADGKPILEQVSVSFTEQHATDARLLDKWNSNTPGWRQNHYYWKAISQFKRFYAPGIMTGSYMQTEIAELIDAGPAAPELPTYTAPKRLPKAPGPTPATATTAPAAETKPAQAETKQPEPETEPAAEETKAPFVETPADPNARIDTKQATAIRNGFLDKGLSQKTSLEFLKSFGAKDVMDVRADKFEAIMAELTKGDNQ